MQYQVTLLLQICRPMFWRIANLVNHLGRQQAQNVSIQVCFPKKAVASARVRRKMRATIYPILTCILATMKTMD